MEEVQSWWEVPAVAHFCYAFRTSFNLFFFEIDELESALLNIQDPDMSISLEQLVMRLLEGYYDKESINEDDWEEKLHELFNDNLEGEENPLGESYFPHLSPRSKIEVLFKLCELRLDVEGALDDIKNIPSEDMQAKRIGKDSQNNTYWYFCNERLYREASSEKKLLAVKNKNVKNESTKIRQTGREKRHKTNPNVDKSWSVACFSISDWEQLSNSFSKSKKSQDKELSAAMKDHLPLLQERVAEKDRFLRKRFLELAPKRSSSRISKVQEKKKIEELKAAEEARKAQIKAEKLRAKNEALLLKQMKESRQRRAEERSKAIEERAERAKLRKLMRVEDTSEEEEEDHNSAAKNLPSVKSKRKDSRRQFTKKNAKEESGDNSLSENQNNKYLRTRKAETWKNNSDKQADNKRCIRTNLNNINQSENLSLRSNKTVKDKNSLNLHKTYALSSNSRKRSKVYSVSQKTEETSCNNESSNKNSCSSISINTFAEIDTKNSNCTKTEHLSPKQNSLNLCSNSYRRYSQAINAASKISVYNSSVISNTPDASKWNAAFGSKVQNMVLYKSSDNLAPKRIKLEQVNFRALPTSMKSSLIKENHLYKPVQFITYGKIIPSSNIVKLEYNKSPNQQVSS